MTLTENLSNVINDTQGPQKYPWKQLYGCTSMREHGTKTAAVFLLAEREASWSLLPSLVSLPGHTVQRENTYSLILKLTGQVWESQKRISISTNQSYTSVDLPKPVSADLTIKPHSVSTNPIGKDGVWSWSM